MTVIYSCVDCGETFSTHDGERCVQCDRRHRLRGSR